MKIYLIGSLRNPEVPILGNELRTSGAEVYDDWYAPGPETDTFWKTYETDRGHNYLEALQGYHARQVFEVDYHHLNMSHGAVLILPAGKSGHLEAGFVAGQGKPLFILLDEDTPERLDIMTRFATQVFSDQKELIQIIEKYPWPKLPDIAPITVAEAHWLAGVLEGDGSFCLTDKNPMVVLQMTDRDVVAHAAKLFGGNVWKGKITSGGKQVWGCGRAGLPGIEWMRILRPYMGSRRQQQIVTSVRGWLKQRTYRKQDQQWWERVFHLTEEIR